MQECMSGCKDCSDETACAMYCEWRPVKQVLCQLLDEQSVGKLAQAVRDGHCQLRGLSLDLVLAAHKQKADDPKPPRPAP
jgi:hypothetical protein